VRIAVVSDIHGNLTAFEAVLADLRVAAPDLVLHGGDLADSGSSPIEIVDRVRDLGWPGVMGNTDEMLVNPMALESFASQSTAPPHLWAAVRKIASATSEILGEQRLAWIRSLPLVHRQAPLGLVHASPTSCWHAPASDATDATLEATFSPLAQPVVVFGHTHRPFVRTLPGAELTVANAGSVGLPYDGDPRASYALIDSAGTPQQGETDSLRRVRYDLERELRRLSNCGLPGADWTARMLRSASPGMP
jgi:putative phosphoesterase